ncbi:hypothetical protein [Henriciella algicola]|uniref:Replication initiation factor domain-containing protein n=1 Tax=Henriciella algicola TaxID=1608422 RepID=A0A399RAA9_9PROT|nr:hypothetical protein [Henriciella algicola]RIJ27713.1 hypothetical protein D1222_15190 [Henriciella algicola]
MTDFMFLRSGFDTLELAYQGKVPPTFLDELADAKKRAAETRQAEPITFNGLTVIVEGSGGQGGYAYRVNTGPFGAIWKFRDRPSNNQWDIHVKIRAYALATKGLQAAKSECDEFLKSIGVAFDPMNARVGRADFAFDFLAPNLELNSNEFVSHARTTKADQIDREIHGDRISYLRIGKLPGKQVCIYDKSKAITDKRDIIWEEIFKAKFSELGILAIDKELPKGIWRIELRAGKNQIEKYVKPRRWDVFESNSAEIFQDISRAISWRQQTADSNRSRWPYRSIWTALSNNFSSPERGPAYAVLSDTALSRLRTEHSSGLSSQFRGVLATMAAIDEVSDHALVAFAQKASTKAALEISSSFNWEAESSKRRLRTGLYRD